MLGLILNCEDHWLPEGSPWRTREEERQQPPLFHLRDGFAVFEVWFYRRGVWWCWTMGPALYQGVRYFRTIEDLKASVGAWQKNS